MRLDEIHGLGPSYKGEPVRIIKAVKSDETGKIIQYKVENMDKTWTEYVKPEQLEIK